MGQAADDFDLQPDELYLLRFLAEYGGWMGIDLISPIIDNVLQISSARLEGLAFAGLTRFEDGAEKLHLTDLGRAVIESIQATQSMAEQAAAEVPGFVHPSDGHVPDALAHIPPEGRIDLDDAGFLSELVARDVAYLHLERQDAGYWWLTAELSTGDRLVVTLESPDPEAIEITPQITREPSTEGVSNG